jgi:D-glycero-D-manno-heptose 1,7-bisphosphate phosphatase
MRAIFLDKDGTLVEDIPYNIDPAKVTLCRHVTGGLRLLQQQGYALFIVSNQAGIAKGLFTEAELRAMLDYLSMLLHSEGIMIRDVYYCPHSPDGSVAQYSSLCTCRKPMPGLLQQAAREHGIELTTSWMIGDILNDVEAGRRAGCRTVLIDNGNETEWLRSPLRTPTLITNDIYSAAKSIILLDTLHSPSQEELGKP